MIEVAVVTRLERARAMTLLSMIVELVKAHPEVDQDTAGTIRTVLEPVVARQEVDPATTLRSIIEVVMTRHVDDYANVQVIPIVILKNLILAHLAPPGLIRVA